MRFLKKIWRFALLVPFSWLGTCLFRPTTFKRAFEGRLTRRAMLLRLFLPILIISYPFTLILFELSFPFALIVHSLSPLSPNWPFGISTNPGFLLITVFTTAFGIVVGLWLGNSLGLSWSIITGMVGGIVLGIVGEDAWILAYANKLNPANGFLVGGFTAITGGILGCVAGAVAGRIGLNMRQGITTGIIGGLVAGAMGGVLGGISLGIVAGMALGILAGIIGGMGRGILASMGKGLLIGTNSRRLTRLFRRWGQNRGESVVVGYITGVEVGIQMGVTVGILGGILMRVLSGLARQLPFFSLQEKASGLAWGLAINYWGGFAWGSALGCATGIAFGIWLGVVMGGAGGLAWGLALGIAIFQAFLIASLLAWACMGVLTGGIAWGIGVSIFAALTFVLCYIIGYYRWPLYPISACSSLWAYVTSKKNPHKVFECLKRSALHWDECIYPLPLPFLDRLLICAVEQDSNSALEEMVFISHQRPRQIAVSEAATYKIAMKALETCSNLQDIAAVSEQLKKLSTIRPQWVIPFSSFNAVSEGAALYRISLRRDTLKGMREDLEHIAPLAIFRNRQLGESLNTIVKNWLEIVQCEQAQHPLEVGQLDNPYRPGPVLSDTDSPFVGRRDLVRTLEAGLRKGRGRPALMLRGERRMGKSSTLKQLPHLLESPHYVPIFYDLQNTATTTNTPTLLFTIAAEIQYELASRDIQVKQLDIGRLNEASRENEAYAYHVFDEWLKDIERMLEKRGWTLLLLFDEFEKLAEFAEEQYLNLHLLLNWVRSTVQHRPQLALLFSGIQPVGEMPSTARIRWTDYFVNFETHKVSFLRPDEARFLIRHPTAFFPSEHIFGQGVEERACLTRSFYDIDQWCSARCDQD